MKFLLAIASLLALTQGRRHLCDDGKRPICAGGQVAVYNRPTGKNTKKSTYFPPDPVCQNRETGEPYGPPECADGSVAKYRFNTCTKDEMKCPNGQGWGPHDKPFPPCPAGLQCHCPGGGKNCQFQYKVCGDTKLNCRRQCKVGLPHCPWNTKNRNQHDGIRIHNTGDSRPGNVHGPRGPHHWGPAYPGNRP